ncbi:VanZ like family protein [Virgibacillus subterraneus]|uniref:VanZ like family protein n=2 Tax=Virgibacillus subterraneus TaxID=621109 RepID=A0A1H9C0Y2_9BACI|nr:VanZ like family protein [Virgibacillus subterraneus]
MHYINALPVYSILLSLVIFISIRFIILRKTDRKIVLYQEFIYSLWIIYMESLLYLTVFPSTDATRSDWVGINLIPFNTIENYLFLFFQGEISVASVNLLGNTVVFVPMGILLVLVNSKISFKKMFLIGIGTSLTIEVTQLVLSLLNVLSRSFDVDDLILNTTGVIIGFALMKIGFFFIRLKK